MDTCRVSVHQNTFLLGKWGRKVWEEGTRRHAWNRVGRPGWMGLKGPGPMVLAVWLRVGVLLTSPLPDQCPCPQLWGHAQG